MTDLPEPEIKPARRSLLERVSVVWLVPIGALVISLAIAWQNYASRGPLIEIAFTDAEGIRPGETELRYRDVPVGVVEEVTFSEGLDFVLVEVRIDQNIAAYVDAESEFWVVRPRVTAQGVTGLSTVLGGVYIQGSWDTVAEGLETTFQGLSAAPVARPDVPGLQIILSSATGEGLLQGTPILYRGVQVGAVSALSLAEDGQSVLAEAFVEAPYDQLISSSTRFWNASGFSFTLGPGGATLDVSSLAALVSGGVSLANLVTGGEQVEPGTTFELYPSRAEALSSVFVGPETANRVTVGFIFSGDVSGLSVGSAVEYQGLSIGEVAGVTGIVDEDRFGDRSVRLLATVELDPTRVVVRDDDAEEAGVPSAEDTLEILANLAENGVRAHLARGSIFVGGLKIVLAEEPDAEEASLDQDAQPFPIFPTTDAEVPEVADTVEGLIARVNELPIEEVLDGTSTLLQNVNSVIGSDAVQSAPDEVLGLVGDVRGLVGSEEVQQMPGEVATILADLQEAVTDVREVLAELREAGAATALAQALEQSAPAIETLNRILTSAEPAVAELPALVERLGAAAEDIATAAETVANLPLGDVVASAAETAEAARTLIASQAVQDVPEDVSAVLEELEATLQQVREAELVARTSTAVDSAGEAAATIAQATENLPGLIARVEAVAADIEALPLAATVAAAEQTLASANELIASEGAQALPAELNTALAELRSVLAEFRTSGVVGQVNETLAEASRTATAIREATADVPQVVAGIEELTQTANALPLKELAADLASAADAAEQALASVNAILASEGVQALPAEISSILTEVQSALAQIRTTGLVAQVNDTLTEAGQAAAAIREATAQVPQVVAGIEELTQTANALPLQELASDLASAAEAAERALASANAILGSEGVQTLPGEIGTALAEVRSVLADIRTSGVVAQVNDTLTEAGRTATAIREATAQVPQVVAGIDQLTQTANALPLERLTADLADLATSAEALLATEGAQELPASLNAALDEVQASLAELREGGLIASANQTLASTRDAAAAVEQASESLPELAARLDALADQAERTLSGYDEGSQLTREAQATLREVQAAARAVSSLARQIERNPNSLLLGR